MTFDKSGKWYAVGKYKSGSATAYTTTNNSWTNNTTLSFGSNSEPYWEVTPPAVSGFSVSTDGSSTILSGTGTSENPYIISYNGSLKLTLSGSKAKTDANSSLQYNTNNAWNSTTSRTISGITSTTSMTAPTASWNRVFGSENQPCRDRALPVLSRVRVPSRLACLRGRGAPSAPCSLVCL